VKGEGKATPFFPFPPFSPFRGIGKRDKEEENLLGFAKQEGTREQKKA
jgi:hypothetical protein